MVGQLVHGILQPTNLEYDSTMGNKNNDYNLNLIIYQLLHCPHLISICLSKLGEKVMQKKWGKKGETGEYTFERDLNTIMKKKKLQILSIVQFNL